jgi:hypothetical protein
MRSANTRYGSTHDVICLQPMRAGGTHVRLRLLTVEGVEQGFSPALSMLNKAGFSRCGNDHRLGALNANLTSAAEAAISQRCTAGLKACSTPSTQGCSCCLGDRAW